MKIKRNFKALLALILAFVLVICLNVSCYATVENMTAEGKITDDTEGGTADKPSSSFKLSESVRENCEFTLVLSVNTSASHAFNGTIGFNHELLTLEKIEGAIDNWTFSSALEQGSITYLAIDTLLEYPASGECDLLKMTFSINEGVKADTMLEFYASTINASDLSGDFELEGSTLNAMVDRALSSKAVIHSLTVEGQALENFDENVKEYSLTVSGEVESLSVEYTCDPFAKVELSSTELAVGENTVIIKVTSEDASTQDEYVLKVTRGRPEGYVPSSNSLLSSIELSQGMLLPSFDPSVKEYILCVPGGVQSVTVTPTVQDTASSAQPLEINTASDKTCKLAVTAEDGSTTEYTFTVALIADDQFQQENNDPAEPSPDVDDIKDKSSDASGIVTLIILIIVGFTAFFIGFVVAFAIKNKKKASKEILKSDKKNENTEENKTE